MYNNDIGTRCKVINHDGPTFDFGSNDWGGGFIIVRAGKDIHGIYAYTCFSSSGRPITITTLLQTEFLTFTINTTSITFTPSGVSMHIFKAEYQDWKYTMDIVLNLHLMYHCL